MTTTYDYTAEDLANPVGNNSLSLDKVMIQANAYLRGALVSMVNYQAGFATADIKLYIEPRETRFFMGKTSTGL